MAQYCDLVALLRAVPLLAKLDPIKLKLLAFSSSYLSLETGEVLFHKGEVADSVYIIDEGEAEIIIGEGCDEVRTGKLGKLGLVGEKEVFCNQPRSATIRAAGTLKVVRLDADVFLRIVSENVGVALGVLQILSDKLASKECSASGCRSTGPQRRTT